MNSCEGGEPMWFINIFVGLSLFIIAVFGIALAVLELMVTVATVVVGVVVAVLVGICIFLYGLIFK